MDPAHRQRYNAHLKRNMPSIQLTPFDTSNPRWRLCCNSLEDWQALAEKLSLSDAKCERNLHSTLVDEFLGELPTLFEIKVGYI